MWPLIEEVLKTEAPHDPSETGRQRFLRRRAGDVQKIYAVTLPNYVTLSDDVWKASDVLNEDQLEYLTTLISTQKMEPAVWEELYASLAEHLPDAVEVIKDEDSGMLAPHCAVCKKPLWFHPQKCKQCKICPEITTENNGWSLLLGQLLEAIERHGQTVTEVHVPLP